MAEKKIEQMEGKANEVERKLEEISDSKLSREQKVQALEEMEKQLDDYKCILIKATKRNSKSLIKMTEFLEKEAKIWASHNMLDYENLEKLNTS